MYIDYLSNSRTNGVQTGREYLTQDELAIITKREFTNPRLDRVRDIFLFSCLTGLNYQDIKKLRRKNVITAIDGTQWLIIQIPMTSRLLNIPLSTNANMILEKYKDMEVDELLPIPSIQKLNAYLKEVATECILDRKLSFQSARNTFIVTIGVANDVPALCLSKIVGFRDHATTRSRISDKQVNGAMVTLSKKIVAHIQD